MPELGAVLEVGPGVKFWISRRDALNPFYVRMGVRACISADPGDFDIGYEGLRGDVRLIYRNETWLENLGIRVGGSVGVDAADRDYNTFVYDVDPLYATPERPAYEADGGYSGFSLSFNAVKDLTRRLAVGAYYRWDNISGAVYEDSPLIRDENNHVFGAAVIWRIFESKRTSSYGTSKDGTF